MYGTMALPRSVESPNSLCGQPGVEVRHHTLPQNPDLYQAQRLALRKQCTAYYQHNRDLSSPNNQQQCLYPDQFPRRFDYSPARREYERFTIPEERGLEGEGAIRRVGDRSRSCDRYPRPLSPVSRFANTPSPLPRSLSRGSSRSCQSSSADESGREGGGGGASSSGIGLSGSSANSSRRASCCSSGTGSSRLTYHSNAVTLIGSNLSRDSINSRIFSGTPELTVKDVTPRVGGERRDVPYFEEGDQEQEHQDEGDLKSDSHCPQNMDCLENELTCPICLDLFHDPVLLPCAHNLCSGCVEQFFATHGGKLSESPGSRVVFQCPTCREIVALDNRGVSGLRRNLTLQNIVESYRRAAATSPGVRRPGVPNDYDGISDEESSASNISTQSDGSLGPSRSRRRLRHKDQESQDYVHLNTPPPKLEVKTVQQSEEIVLCQFCDLDPARVAVKTCLTCRAYYCDRCLRVTHPRKKPFVNHKLVPATPGSAGTLSASHSTVGRQRSHTTCFNHTNEVADLYCANCDLFLCKICSLATEHGNHVIHNVNDWCQKKKGELEVEVAGMTKQKAEMERILNLFAEAYQETENNAAAQEAKLQAECETLIRIVNERREAISAKIKETKGNRIRRLSQNLQSGKQCLEDLDSAIAHASDVTQQDHNTARFFQASKIAEERINQALSSAKLVGSRAEDLANPGFYLDFTQEKTLLDKLDILEAPAVPRICEELCTQSHDKVTIQWRLSDARHTESYELQYAIDDRWLTPESPPDGWMIVPNIKECSYTIHGMQTGTRYIFAVKAVNKAGATRSEIVTIKTLGMPFAFDTHSMHKKLRLANHGYTVSREDSNKKSKDSGSGSSLCGVSGNVSIEAGRHYWEVVVCQSTSFTLGVAYANVPRFEWTGKNNMSWCLCRSNQEWSVRHDNKDMPIHLITPFPKKIGVLLDYDSGLLSFFDGASGRRIHTFKIDFKRAIRPSFAVGNKSLTINTGITIPDQLQLPIDSVHN